MIAAIISPSIFFIFVILIYYSFDGSGIKNFGLRVGSTFNKIAPKALHYGRLITGGLSKLPGVIGTAAGIVHRGMSYADNIINSLPDSNLKDKLKSLEKNGSEFINKDYHKCYMRQEDSSVWRWKTTAVLDRCEIT